MAKRINARAIILDQDDVILMFRRKINNNKIKEYYAIPGGGKEKDETLEECVIREIKEEFNLDIKPIEQLGIVEDENNIGYIYSTEILGGNLQLGGEEKEGNKEDNYYEIRKIKINDIDKYDILEENKKFIRLANEKRKKEYK